MNEEIALREELAPVKRKDRIGGLDLLRGFAILGIIPANMPSFNTPMMIENPFYFSSHWSEGLAHGLMHALIDTKFRTLFAIMFGAGLALQWTAARKKGRAFHPFYIWRQLLLIVIGLCHGWFLWYGDILFSYAIIGIAASVMVRTRPKTLLFLGALGVTFTSLIFLLIGYLQYPAGESPAALTQPQVQAAVANKPDSEFPMLSLFEDLDPGYEARVYREGTYLQQLKVRFVSWFYLMVFMFIYGWRLLGLFLLGIAFMKLRLFEAKGQNRITLKWMLGIGLGSGLLLEWPGAVLVGMGTLSEYQSLVLSGIHGLGALALALAYMAAVLLLPKHLSETGMLRFVSSVGRVALSAYLFETVACTVLFYSYGFGLNGSLNRVEIWAASIALGLLVIALAHTWTRFFHFGPVEWLWRSMAYFKVQPFLKRA
jgi:uncharacterized protein